MTRGRLLGRAVLFWVCAVVSAPWAVWQLNEGLWSGWVYLLITLFTARCGADALEDWATWHQRHGEGDDAD